MLLRSGAGAQYELAETLMAKAGDPNPGGTDLEAGGSAFVKTGERIEGGGKADEKDRISDSAAAMLGG